MFRALGWALARSATRAEIITADETTAIPEMSKQEMAERILDAVVKLRAGQQTPKVTALGMAKVLDEQSRKAVAATVRYYRELGIYDLYRREVRRVRAGGRRLCAKSWRRWPGLRAEMHVQRSASG